MANPAGKQQRLRKAISRLKELRTTASMKKPVGGSASQPYTNWLSASSMQAQQAAAQASAVASAFEAAQAATVKPAGLASPTQLFGD